MARPCGCSGECACTYIGVDGIRVTGTGTTRDPGRIGLATPLTGSGCDAIMSCVGSRLGAGLRQNPLTGTLAVALSADSGNTAIYGSDGGVYTSGGTGGGSGQPTVAGLIAQTTPIIGGTYGAGYSMFPEGNLRGYQVAMDMELPLIHVPVRRSREYFLLAQAQRGMGYYNANYTGTNTDDMDLSQGQFITYRPNGDPAGPPRSGYFGYGYPESTGQPTLVDVFNAVNRRAVMYLEIKDIGLGASDVATPEATLNPLGTLLTQHGLGQSVIVGVEYASTATTADITSINNGLTTLKNAGVAIAAHLTTEAEVDAVTPANCVAAGITWVFIAYGVADTAPAKVKAYKTAGLKVMLHGGNRQWHYNLVTDTVRFGTGGLKGILCTDPVYCAGALNNYRYRKPLATWGWGTPDYGRHSNWSNTVDGQRDRYRGYVQSGLGGTLSLDGDVLNPTDTSPTLRPSGYYILMGEQCPVPFNTATSKYDSYDIDCSFTWDALIADRARWIGIHVCVPEDRALTESGQSTQYTKGYLFTLGQNGDLTLTRYDGIPYSADPAWQYRLAWASGWGTITPGAEYRIKVRVRPDRIVCGRYDQVEGGTNTRTFNASLGGGTTWRGQYAYITRHFFATSDSCRIRWANFQVTAV